MQNLFRKMSEISRIVVWIIFFAVSIWVLNTGLVFASVNQEMSYQATLKDSSGSTVPNGNYNIRFKLYASSTGGTSLWNEEWCRGSCNGGAGADNRVSVTNGLLSLQLGQLTSLSTVDFNQTLYLGVEVGGSSASATWDGEMTPRKRIGSAAGAFNSDKLNGQAASYYLDANNLNNLLSRFATFLSATTTNALAEGSNNLYFTNARARSALSSASVALTYSTSTGAFTLADASTASSGVVTTGAQSFAGAKTFTGDITGNSALTVLGNSTMATGTYNGTLGIGIAADTNDRLRVSGALALGLIASNSSISSNTGFGKIFSKSATGNGNDVFSRVLLHMDGDNNSTTFIDSSPSALTYTAYNGAHITSTPLHFGTGVGAFNGTSSRVSSPSTIDLTSISSADEVDMWVYSTSTVGVRPIMYIGTDIGTSTPSFFALRLDSGVPTMEYKVQNSGSTTAASLASSGGAISASSWHHLAVARTLSGSTYTFVMYVDGTSVGSTTAQQVQGTTGNAVCVGSNACWSGGNDYYAGYIDELRFSRGSARYSDNFSPPTSPYGSGLFYTLENGTTLEVGCGCGSGGGAGGGALVDTSAFHRGGDSFATDILLGLQDAHALSFITNNATRMSITASGNIGIGTTTPDTLLTVAGNARFAGGVTFSGFSGGGLLKIDASGTLSTTSAGTFPNLLSSAANIITSTVNSVVATTTLINSSALSWLGNQITSTINGVTATTSIPYASTSTDGLVSTTTQTFGGDKTFNGKIIASTTGNIIPFFFANQAAFPSATTYHGAIAHSHADGAMYFAHDLVWTQLLDVATGFKNGGSSFSAIASIGTNDAFPLRFIASSSEAIRITTAGGVGIGTTSPLALLDVYGDSILEGSNRYLNFGTGTSTAGYGFRDSGGIMQFKNLGGSWTSVATTTDSLAEGTSSLYFTDTRSRNAISASSTGLSYSTSTGVLSLSSGFSLLDSNSAQTIAGNKTLSGALVVQGTSTLSTTTIANLTLSGLSTFNGAVSLASTLSVTGTSTLATTTATKFTASGATSLSSTLTLGALTGGLIQTDGSGVVSTTSIAALTTHTLSSSANVLTSTVNGASATSSIINTNALSWSGQTLTSTINGIATTTIISLANATTDGLMSSTTQAFGGNKTFNGTVSLASSLGVTGTSTLATTTATQFTASGASTLSAALTLSALTGGLLQTSAGGVVSTTSIAALTTHTISSVANVLTSIVNGVISTTTAVNSVAPSSSGNIFTSNVNGVTGTTTIINSTALAWSGQTLTSTVNGISTTTNISFASSTADGLMSTTTQTFAGSKTFSSAPTFSTMTSGSVLFAGTGGLLSQSNSGLFWDNTNSRLGIGTTTPTGALSFAGLEYGFIGGNSNISQIATVTVGSSPVGAALNGKYMYVANSGTSTISVIDIANPTSPTNIATVDVGGAGPLNVLVSGQYLFVTNNGSSTLSVLDAANPGNPRLIATTSVGTSPRNEAMSGHYVFTTNNGGNTISVVDVTNPYAPRQVATTSVGTAPRGMTALGQYVYVANSSDNTISVVNVSNPLTPSQVSTVSTGGGDPRNIFIAGRYAYVANFASSTMAVIDISNPLVSTLVATTSVGTNPQGISLGGRYAYVGNAGSNNISVVDISNPLAPRQIATTSVGTGPTQLRVNGRYVYVMNTTAGTVSVVDVGGADLGNLYAGSLESGALQILSDIGAQGNVNVGSSLFVGPGGIQSGGGLSITSSTSISVIMGKFGIGTTSPTSALSVVGTSTLATTTVSNFTATDGVTFSTMTAGSIFFATSSGLLSQDNSKFFWDDANNRLGIGTSTPTVGLQVTSNTIRLNDNQNTAPTRNNTGEIGVGAVGTANGSGRIWIRAGATPTNFVFNSSGTGDFSEFFHITDSTLKTGELATVDVRLSTDASSTRYVSRSEGQYNSQVIGVVARPGEGTQNNNSRDGDREDDPTYKNISLLGQTPVYVTDENGLVQAGDRLTSSSRAGYAMKMTHGGMSIGYALSDATTTDQLVEAYVDPGQFMTPGEAGLVSELVSTSTDVSLAGALGGLYRHLIAWFASATNGITDLFAHRIITHELCIDDDTGARTCINKQSLDALLSGAHVNNIYTPPSSGSSSSSTPPSTTSSSTDPVASSTTETTGGGAATSTSPAGGDGGATSTTPSSGGGGTTGTTTEQSNGSGASTGDTTSVPPSGSASSTAPN